MSKIKNDELAVFREQLQYYRKKSGMTQAQLAEKVDVSEHYIRLIENGYSVPSVELFMKICSELDIPAYHLLQSQKDTMRFTKPNFYDKLKAMDEHQLNTILNILFQ